MTLLNGALPDLALSPLAAAGAAGRCLALAGMACGFGTALFPTLLAREGSVNLRPLAGFGVSLGLLGLVLWAGSITADLTNAAAIADLLAGLPGVLLHTWFGQVISAQGFCLVLALFSLGLRTLWPAIALACGAAQLMQAAHSHSYAMYDGPSLLLLADVVHIMAAATWLGCLPPLLLIVRRAPPRLAALACRRFSPLGRACVLVLAGSAAWQFWVLIGTLPGLVGTQYGWIVLAKTLLFAVLILFALANHYRLAPALYGDDPARARARLTLSLAWQSTAGLATLAAAALLSASEPAMHIAAVWPFSQRLSLDALAEPELRQEVVLAMLAIAAALALLAIALWSRRLWGALLGAALILAGLAVPHLDLLFVPAWPTSFAEQPTPPGAEALVHGAALFRQNCVACHGPGGRGDGPRAAALAVPPADLTAHLSGHLDGELFWWIGHGIEEPDGSKVMPGFIGQLSPDDIWDLIAFLRLQAGDAPGTVAHHHH